MSASRRPTRDYLPLATSGLVLLVLLAALPSALDLPQANPSETLEYAPIPPEGDEPPPPVGNLSSLSLASGRGIGSGGSGGGAGPGDEIGEAPAGRGKNPSTKRCVGVPPRQTEDRLSPPCVAHFSGDNFGATHGGVTATEVRVLVHVRGGYDYGGEGASPRAAYVDLGQPPSGAEGVIPRVLRNYQRYFNDRYQTYGRFVHFWLYFNSGTTTAEERRSEAIANMTTVQPFAVITALNGNAANEGPYIDEIARRGGMNFGSFYRRLASEYQRHPTLLWSFKPSVDQQARQFTDYVCSKMAGRPVTFGDPTHMGEPRKFGMLSTTDPRRRELQALAAMVRRDLNACGATIEAEATFAMAGSNVGADQNAVGNMSSFKQQGITTIIWPGGLETSHTKAAGAAQYRPEWVVAGDGTIEGNNWSAYQEQSVWRNAITVANGAYTTGLEGERCYDAYKEVDPEALEDQIFWACNLFYDSLRQLFTGIQVAGPRLSPANVDKGFHAIPATASTDPKTPACYYEPGDYTCVKDAMAMWWDPTGVTGSPLQGCWRAMEAGRRYRAGDWPDGDPTEQKRPEDPCNVFNPPT